MTLWQLIADVDAGYRDLLLTLVLGAVTLVAVVCVAAIVFSRVTLGVCTSSKRMDGKTVIITGANSGIGKVTAQEMAKRGARVILACRNLEAAQQVQDEIVAATKNNNVVVKKLDLSLMASVREFSEDVRRTEQRLDVLIHNAGVANTFSKRVTPEGLEITMATNQFGPYLLTHLLMDLLKRSAPSRIVVVASSLYRFASVNLDNPNPVGSLPAYLYYSSKYANILFARELARRLEGTGVTANCLHPGLIDSGIWRNVPIPFSWFMTVIIKGFFKTPEQGAQTSIYLATSEGVEGVTGKYFSDCKEASLSSSVEDMDKAKKYWEICAKLVQLSPADPKI